MEDISEIFSKSQDEIRAIQDDGVRRMMALCEVGHAYYREVFSDRGIQFSDIRNIEDLERIPPTSKEDYMTRPEEFVLRLPEAPLFEKIIYNMLYTTGTTTGKPTPFYNTAHDYYATLMISKRVAQIVGLTPEDTIANTYPLTTVPHLTFFAAFWYATVIGARLVSTLTGTPNPEFPVTNSSRHAAKMVETSEATVLWGIPSFLRRLLTLAEEMGLDYHRVRMAAVAGEPCSQGLREDLIRRLERLGAKTPHVNNRFGFTEISTVLVECDREGKGGFHNPAPDHFFLEVIDPETGKRLEDGKPGYLAVTHLNRRGTVLLRYLTGDIVVLSHDPCPYCGRQTTRVVSQPFRKSSLIKFKGTLINPEPLVKALSGIPEIDEFQIVFTRQNPEDPLSPDHLQIKVATSMDEAVAREKVIDICLQTVEMRPEILFVPKDDIYDPDKGFKSKRIVDLRKIENK